MTDTLSLRKPDDWHVHFRDQAELKHTVAATANHFERALVMPNLKPALTTLPSLLAYRERILAASPNPHFTPYMTFYLNEQVTPQTLQEAIHHPFILGAKLYPQGVTTNAEQGASSIKNLYPLFEVMQDAQFVLQIHGECPEGDIFEREELFIQSDLKAILKNFPKLRIVLEHISTQAAVDFVSNAPAQLAATITPHHLFYNRNQLLAGGIKPHYYCLPILKHARDQAALLTAAVSGHPKFFAGTDSAPHSITSKESACGCAGIYSAPFAIALYAHAFDNQNQLTRLNPFLSQFGADFYQQPYNTKYIEIERKEQKVPEILPLGNTHVIPIAAGEQLSWSIHV